MLYPKLYDFVQHWLIKMNIRKKSSPLLFVRSATLSGENVISIMLSLILNTMKLLKIILFPSQLYILHYGPRIYMN